MKNKISNILEFLFYVVSISFCLYVLVHTRSDFDILYQYDSKLCSSAVAFGIAHIVLFFFIFPSCMEFLFFVLRKLKNHFKNRKNSSST